MEMPFLGKLGPKNFSIVTVDILEYRDINEMLHLLSSVIVLLLVCLSAHNFLTRLLRVPHSCALSRGSEGHVDTVNCHLVEILSLSFSRDSFADSGLSPKQFCLKIFLKKPP